MRKAFWSICLFLMVTAVFAQSDRGTITGTISDPTGAMMSGAAIAAINTQTGTEYKTASTTTGNFTLAQLPAGTYELTVTAAGFKKYVRPGIIVSVAQTVRTDVKLEVGQITETVTVEESAPLLKTESGELSHTVATERVDDIPLMTLGGGAGILGGIRNPLQVVELLPGSSFASNNTLRVNGMPSSTQAIRIEGQDATNGIWRQLQQTNQAGLDAIQEVAVQTSNYAPEYGNAGGGYFNYSMKSGTNALHGSAYDYNVNEAYNAGTPNTDDGTGKHQKATQRRNDYGFTFGGPVYIPRVYDGRDKTFFFFTFEQFRETQNIVPAYPSTVPTAAYRKGDFSAALGSQLTRGGQPVVDPLGRPVYQNQLYNPFKTYLGPNNEIMRDPIMGCDGNSPNVICTDPGNPNYIPLDPVAVKAQSYFPDPLGPFAGQVANNYATPAYKNWRTQTIPSVKIDHSLTPKVKISGYWSEAISYSPGNNGFQGFAFNSATIEDNHSHTARFNYDHTLTPTMLFHAGVGYMYIRINALAAKIDRNTLGFKTPFFSDLFPNLGTISIAGAKGGMSISMGSPWSYEYQKDNKETANVNLTWVKGNHTIKAGGELIVDGQPVYNYSRTAGTYTFDAQQTGLPWESGQGFNSTTGINYASFLLGLTNSLQVAAPSVSRMGNHTMGFYIQDTWKATRKLTVDYGLRYDLSTLLREQYGRMQNANFTKINPTIVPLGASQGLPGLVEYEANCNCRFGQTYKFAFGPRLGVAYQIDNKTVFRAGAGISYGSSPVNSFLSLSIVDFYGYSPDGYGNPATILQNGNPRPNITFPDFTAQYPGETAPGYRPPVSPFISIADNTGRPPRIFQWSIGLQREIMRNLVVEASYVGNRGAWWTAPLVSSQNYNALRPEELLTQRKYGATTGLDVKTEGFLLNLPISNPSVIAKFPLLANPNNVYIGFPSSQPLRQALRPYPQWFGIPPFLGPPMGNTWYDSLQAKVTKRFSHGLDFQGAFTWQKELTLGVNSDTSYLTPQAPIINDVFDRMSNKQLSGFSRPVMLVISFNYTTPKFSGIKALSWMARDWSLGGVLRYSSGALIRTPASNNGLLYALARGFDNNPALWGGGATLRNRVPGQPLLLVDPNSKDWDPNQALTLNPAAWKDAAAGEWGTSAPYFNEYRWQRQPSESLSLGRSFPMKEGRANFSVRIELQNVFNRMFLSAPSATNPDAPTTKYPNGNLSGGYGFVNTFGGAGARPRTGQIVARINF